MKRLLMIDPNFPRPNKSVNHQSIIPWGLLKIGSLYKSRGWDVRLQRLAESDDPPLDFHPSKIIVTSIFTYWSEYVKEAVDWAKAHYPSVNVEVGGVFASLQPQLCREVTGCDSVHIGVIDEAEDHIPDFSLLSKDIDFQVMHTSRGCQRRCKACGVYLCEPKHSFVSTIKDKVVKRKLVFYDNNMLANPNIEDILRELILLKRQKRILHCESQSGFDGRILRKKPYLAKMLKDAGFVYPKIAWDGSVKSWRKRKEEVDILARYWRREHISVFMLTNHEIPYTEMEYKRMHCYEWRVQVNPCRFRPLDQLSENYSPRRKGQTSDDYFIHPNWSDELVKQFNRNVRKHNLSVRYRTFYYSKDVEKKNLEKDDMIRVRYMKYSEAVSELNDAWNPLEFHGVEI